MLLSLFLPSHDLTQEYLAEGQEFYLYQQALVSSPKLEEKKKV
jgi:hypothetical protein